MGKTEIVNVSSDSKKPKSLFQISHSTAANGTFFCATGVVSVLVICLLLNASAKHEWTDALGMVLVYCGFSFVLFEHYRKVKTHRSLLVEKAFCNAAFDSLNDAVLVANAAGHLMMMNEAARTFYGIEGQKLCPERWHEHLILHTSDYSRELEIDEHPLTRCIRGENIDDLEVLVIGSEQQAHYCVVTGRAMRNAENLIVGAVIVLHDASERRRTEQEVNRLASIVECSNDAVVGINIDGIIVTWNAAATRLYEIESSDAIGRSGSILVQSDNTSTITDVIKILLKGEKQYNLEAALTRDDDSFVIVSLRYAPIQDAVGTIIGISATISDITNRKKAEAALYESQRQLEEAQRVAQMGSWELDIVNNELTWSQQMYSLFGFHLEYGPPSLDEISSRFHPDDREIYAEAHKNSTETCQMYQVDIRTLLPDGTTRYLHVVGEPGIDASGKVVQMLGTAMDITERKKAEQTAKEATIALEYQKKALEEANLLLESLATSDGLTGLRNRRALDSQLLAEFSRSTRHNIPLSIVLLDIDKFKLYNDTYGHQAGDDVLKTVAAILKKATRESDIVARYGGEEFCVVLPETTFEVAGLIAERLRAAIEAGQWTFRPVTSSLGVSTLVHDMKDVNELVLAADQALYKSKEDGRNRVTMAERAACELKAA